MGKHVCQSLFFNKVAGITLLKKRLWHRCFPANFVKFLRTSFFTEHLWTADRFFFDWRNCTVNFLEMSWDFADILKRNFDPA